MEPVLLVRYAEIHLKGLNRPFFERGLMKRISLALRPQNARVVREQGRVFVLAIVSFQPQAIPGKLVWRRIKVWPDQHEVLLLRCPV